MDTITFQGGYSKTSQYFITRFLAKKNITRMLLSDIILLAIIFLIDLPELYHGAFIFLIWNALCVMMLILVCHKSSAVPNSVVFEDNMIEFSRKRDNCIRCIDDIVCIMDIGEVYFVKFVSFKQTGSDFIAKDGVTAAQLKLFEEKYSTLIVPANKSFAKMWDRAVQRTET